MALMKDDICVLSIKRQKWDESAKKTFEKLLRIAQNSVHWSTLKACLGVYYWLTSPKFGLNPSRGGGVDSTPPLRKMAPAQKIT